MNNKITVIVPVYNVEKYLRRCVDSLLKQKFSSYEIILVDDGSTDDSGKICDEYQGSNKKIKAIHKENGGLSDARNTGVDKCDTEYIVFVDPDDYVDEDFLSSLWEAKIKYSADIVCSQLIFEFYTGRSKPVMKFEDIITDPTNAQAYTLRSKYSGVSACAKLFKTEYLKKYPYPKGKINEDLRTTYWHLDLASIVAFISKATYHYVQRDESISYATINMATVKESIEVCQDYIKNTGSDEVKQAAVSRIFKLVGEVCQAKDSISSKDRKELQKILRKYKKIALKDTFNSKIDKYKIQFLSGDRVTFWIFRKLQKINRNRYM